MNISNLISFFKPPPLDMVVIFNSENEQSICLVKIIMGKLFWLTVRILVLSDYDPCLTHKKLINISH